LLRSESSVVAVSDADEDDALVLADEDDPLEFEDDEAESPASL
jgi:hypothetical protein